jgi:hypothetical protein
MPPDDRRRSTGRTSALPLVRVTLACRNGDPALREFLQRYRSRGVFIPTERAHPLGERVRLQIQLVDGSADYASEAVIISHERKGSRLGMRLRLEPPRHATPAEVPPRDDAPTVAVSLAEYLCEPGAPSAPPDDRGGGHPGADCSPMLTPGPRAHWPARVRELFEHPPIEAIEGLHHLFVHRRTLEPLAALAAAEALLEIARSDPSGHLVRFVRRLTRDGHEILELALEGLEGAGMPETRWRAQQLFDDTLRTIVVP